MQKHAVVPPFLLCYNISLREIIVNKLVKKAFVFTCGTLAFSFTFYALGWGADLDTLINIRLHTIANLVFFLAYLKVTGYDERTN